MGNLSIAGRYTRKADETPVIGSPCTPAAFLPRIAL